MANATCKTCPFSSPASPSPTLLAKDEDGGAPRVLCHHASAAGEDSPTRWLDWWCSEHREQNVAGAGFLRIDIPGRDGNVATQFYAPGALYCLTPVAEDVARRFALGTQPEPVTRWELPAPRTAQAEEDGGEDLEPFEERTHG